MIRVLLAFTLTLAVCWGLNHSGMLRDLEYGTRGDPDVPDVLYYLGEYDEDYPGHPSPVTEKPDDTEAPPTTVPPTTASLPPTTGQASSSGPSNRNPYRYLNGTLYDDYVSDCEKYSGAPRPGGPAPFLVIVCLAVTVAHEILRNIPNK